VVKSSSPVASNRTHKTFSAQPQAEVSDIVPPVTRSATRLVPLWMCMASGAPSGCNVDEISRRGGEGMAEVELSSEGPNPRPPSLRRKGQGFVPVGEGAASRRKNTNASPFPLRERGPGVRLLRLIAHVGING